MSWNSYIDNMMAYKCFTHVGLFGIDNGACWASTPSFPIAANHVQVVVAGLKDTSKGQAGISVGADKYMFVRGDTSAPASILFKKGANSVYASKSGKCVIIGIHDASAKAETVSGAVGKMVDYLVSIGY